MYTTTRVLNASPEFLFDRREDDQKFVGNVNLHKNLVVLKWSSSSSCKIVLVASRDKICIFGCYYWVQILRESFKITCDWLLNFCHCVRDMPSLKLKITSDVLCLPYSNFYLQTLILWGILLEWIISYIIYSFFHMSTCSRHTSNETSCAISKLSSGERQQSEFVHALNFQLKYASGLIKVWQKKILFSKIYYESADKFMWFYNGRTFNNTSRYNWFFVGS